MDGWKSASVLVLVFLLSLASAYVLYKNQYCISLSLSIGISMGAVCLHFCTFLQYNPLLTQY